MLRRVGQEDFMVKKICTVCNGNGFVRVPFEQAKEEQWSLYYRTEIIYTTIGFIVGFIVGVIL